VYSFLFVCTIQKKRAGLRFNNIPLMATFRSDSRCGEGKAMFKATLAFAIHFEIHFERMDRTTMKKVAAGLSTLCLAAVLAVPAFAATGAGVSGGATAAGNVAAGAANTAGNVAANAANTAGNVAANAANAAGNVAANTANAAGNVAANAANAVGNVTANTANAVGNGVSRVIPGTATNNYPYGTYNPGGSNATAKTDGTYRAYAANNNVDWGWLGLLGLVGLAGLFGRGRSDAR
jgi:hypothetical protein